MIEDIKNTHKKVSIYVGDRRNRFLKCLFWCFIFVVITLQIVYPKNRMLPGYRLDSLEYGFWDKTSVINDVNKMIDQTKLNVYFGTAGLPYRTFSIADLGYKLEQEAIEADTSYSIWQRLIPFSILQNYFDKSDQTIHSQSSAVLSSFLNAEFGDKCVIEPRDANLRSESGEIKIIYSQPSGNCNLNDLNEVISNFKPVLFGANEVRINMNETEALISDQDAYEFIEVIKESIGDSVAVAIGESEKVIINRSDIISWLDFDNSGNKLSYIINNQRFADFFIQKYPNQTNFEVLDEIINLDNFVETSREAGQLGRKIDISASVADFYKYINSQLSEVYLNVTITGFKTKYVHNMTEPDFEISRQISEFISQQDGEFGVSMIEIGGKNRRAVFEEDKIFTSASTYKLFVAYSALTRIENGIWKWTDKVVGTKKLDKCLSDMIIYSNNECAEALLDKIGRKNITTEIKAIGCESTLFINQGIDTTSNDLALFLGKLKTGLILQQQSNRDFLLDIMSRNVYRKGIPAGLGGDYLVANKVGFLDNLLNDAAIVSGPTGDYVLVIMTDDSNWSVIAELTKKIEQWRQ